MVHTGPDYHKDWDCNNTVLTSIFNCSFQHCVGFRSALEDLMGFNRALMMMKTGDVSLYDSVDSKGLRSCQFSPAHP